MHNHLLTCRVKVQASASVAAIRPYLSRDPSAQHAAVTRKSHQCSILASMCACLCKLHYRTPLPGRFTRGEGGVHATQVRPWYGTTVNACHDHVKQYALYISWRRTGACLVPCNLQSTSFNTAPGCARRPLAAGRRCAHRGRAWCSTAVPARSSCSRAVRPSGRRCGDVQHDWSSWQ